MQVLHPESVQTAPLRTSSEWQVLGPFQVGTREASWGADPLESIGGFRSLEYNSQTKYNSSLGTNGEVGWSIHHAHDSKSEPNAVKVTLTVGFDGIDWPFLQSIYGWAALQYQAWARGILVVEGNTPQSVILHTENVLEFWVDSEPFFGGDLYAYRRAPLVLELEPGNHKIDFRLIRDVRVMGGVGKPKISVSLEAQISTQRLAVICEQLLVPDMIDCKLASDLASVPVRNDSKDWIEIDCIISMDDTSKTTILDGNSVWLAPGQSRPLAFRLVTSSPKAYTLCLKILFKVKGSPVVLRSGLISHTFLNLTIHDPHRITFRHPGNIISYAILRAPSVSASHGLDRTQALPVILNLHGAGLEADSQQVRHMLDSIPDLRGWVIFPTGVTTWSGDDWHVWGFSDVEAAIRAITDWIDTNGWKGPSVDINKWLVSGHSNGGQGTWYALTHKPDEIIGAAPVSGYSSIQAYVPFQLWNETDPKLASVVQSSLADYRHELLLENLVGVPIFQQHGSADENVPAFHSRRLSQLISQHGTPSKYVELPGEGHWFDGIMTTTYLRKYFQEVLAKGSTKPDLPNQFTIVIANPANHGSRGGIIVDQLVSPGQLGRLEVERSSSSVWSCKTSNILRFHLSTRYMEGVAPHTFHVDGYLLDVPPSSCLDNLWFLRSAEGSWKISDDKGWRSIQQRYGTQLGAMASILHTRGRFLVYNPHIEAFDVALQISRNLFQYFGADSEIVQLDAPLGEHRGNLITVALGRRIPPCPLANFPVTMDQERGVSVSTKYGAKRFFEFQEGLGAILLRPLPSERLELLIWGYDIHGLRHAARLLPMITGVGQPDFVIVSKKCAWRGAGEVHAMGFFNSLWEVSENSFIA